MPFNVQIADIYLSIDGQDRPLKAMKMATTYLGNFDLSDMLLSSLP
jgi:hypothetical protein